MSKKDQQITGSLTAIEKNVKELKLFVNNYLNEKNLSKSAGTRLYNLQSSFNTNSQKVNIL